MTIGRIPSVEGGIQPTIFDAKADILTATAADTPARLAVGSNNQILMADSAQSTGLKWAGGWTTWSPNYTNLTIGNGTVVARYRQIGNTVEYFWRLTWGTTTSSNNFPIISYPVQPYISGFNNGWATYLDTGVVTYNGASYLDGTNGFLLTCETTSGTYAYHGTVGGTLPTTFGNTDVWTIMGRYEV